MYWNELKKKTWIDWVKILVGIDIASSGIGLILNVDMHVFAYLLRIIGLGFLSRIFFGVLYVFVAVLIFKRIFPQKLAKEENAEAEKMDKEIINTSKQIKMGVTKIANKAAKFTDQTHDKLDKLIDKGEDLISKGKQDIKKEIDKLIKE